MNIMTSKNNVERLFKIVRNIVMIANNIRLLFDCVT